MWRSPYMSKKSTALPTQGIVLGPILGLENTPAGGLRYTCCVVLAGAGVLKWVVAGQAVNFVHQAKLAAGGFHRAVWEGSAPDVEVAYAITVDGAAVAGVDGETAWKFRTPPAGHVGFRFAYASCNGFSQGDILASHPKPYAMWTLLRAAHKKQRHHLLAMGGDQIYADAIWQQDWMREFAHLDGEEKIKAKVTAEVEGNIDAFYEDLYIHQWRRVEVAAVMAVLPSIMMWDDHDIFDGWGSYTKAQQQSRMFRRIFAAAKRAFELFQLRARDLATMSTAQAGSYDFDLKVADTTFLVLDNRAQRTQTEIMTEDQWTALRAWLGTFSGRRLFVLTGVPVVYRRFAVLEAYLSCTPWQEEIEDDVLDHWSARGHQRERVRLIYSLIERQHALAKTAAFAQGKAQWIFLSGDVHVGGVGVVWDEVRDAGLYQMISSAIAHPPPSYFQWKAIELGSSDEPEILGDGDLKAELLVATGAAGNYLRTRNFLLGEVGSDDRLWFEWCCEDGQRPVFSV